MKVQLVVLSRGGEESEEVVCETCVFIVLQAPQPPWVKIDMCCVT